MKAFLRSVLATASLVIAVPALAQEAAEATSEKQDGMRYLLGASLSFGPEYNGASRHTLKVRPLWAVRFGRIRIATSGGSALLGFGRESAGPGASAQLIEGDNWRVGVALRIDSGRDSGNAKTTRGLPNVKRTLRARLYANYSFTKDWNLGASLSQDVLGNDGGLTAGVDLGWRFYRNETPEWNTGMGLSAADAQNMRSYFGVPASAAAAIGKPAYAPGAGLRNLHFGVGFKHAMSKHWFVFGSAGASRLLGPAADSPLVEKPSGAAAAVGVAWRN